MNCPKCGKELADAQKFCPECGANTAAPADGLLEGLSKKIKLEAYVWFGVAAAQAILGIISLISGNFVNGIVLILVGAYNAFNSKKDLQYSKDILTDPKGIVEKYKPIKDLIISLAYNAILGGVIGVAGTVFGFLTRKYVLDNEAAFLALENE